MIKNNKINVFAKLRAPIVYGLLFVLWVVAFDMLLVTLSPWLPERTRIITRTPLYVLAYQHVILSGVSTLLALITAMLAAICIWWIDQDELKSIGLSTWQRIWHIELPLTKNVWLACGTYANGKSHNLFMRA